MHAFELIQLAAIVTAHSAALLRLSKELPPAELARYWTASKCRLDRWQLALNELKASRISLVGPGGTIHHAAASLFNEILTGEILTRTWTAVLAAHDFKRGADHGEPIARSVLAGHLEVRCRTLTFLSTTRELSLGDVAKLDRLRRRCERWTDMLLGELAPNAQVGKFAHDAERVAEFAADATAVATPAETQARSALTLTALCAAFREPASWPSPNSDLNAQIAAGILGCFQPEMFEGSGVLRSAWMARLSSATADVEISMREYLHETGPTGRQGLGRNGLQRF